MDAAWIGTPKGYIFPYSLACSGVRTACSADAVEPSPMVANATLFCFLIDRTKPSTVRELSVDLDAVSFVDSSCWSSCATVCVEYVRGSVPATDVTFVFEEVIACLLQRLAECNRRSIWDRVGLL